MDRSGEEAGLRGIDQEKRIITMAFVLHGMVFGSLGMAMDFWQGSVLTTSESSSALSVFAV